MGLNGQIFSRTISSIQEVLVGGLPVDVSLCTFSEPLPRSEVVPLAYLNLASESSYLNKEVVTFGSLARAGYGKIKIFQDLQPGGMPTSTRTFRLDYRNTANGTTTPDDAHGEIGDSGSPTFVMTEGRPGLVGIHYAVGGSSEATTQYIYDSSIQSYVSQLNTLMAPAGYRMIPFTPISVPLGTSKVKTPATFVAGEEAECQFDLKNLGSGVTGNLTMSLKFPPGAAPDSLTAPGWVVESTGSDEWQFRRGTLASMATVSATAHWESFPARASLFVKVTYGSDGAAEKTHFTDLSPVSSYAQWSQHFPDPDPLEDSDGDGLSNLLEYAFAGDPHHASWKTVAGNDLMPAVKEQAGLVSMTFPVRNDSSVLYEVEYSATMEDGTWSAVPPVPVTSTTLLFESGIEGYSRRTISYSIGEMPHVFTRVRVKLPE